MKLSSLKLKNFLHFPKKPFLHLGNGTFSGENFRSSKKKTKKKLLLKTFLHFRKLIFLASNLKTSYISGGNLQSLKIKNYFFFYFSYIILYFSSKVPLHFGMTADQLPCLFYI